jgi:hypothetical protein
MAPEHVSFVPLNAKSLVVNKKSITRLTRRCVIGNGGGRGWHRVAYHLPRPSLRGKISHRGIFNNSSSDREKISSNLQFRPRRRYYRVRYLVTGCSSDSLLQSLLQPAPTCGLAFLFTPSCSSCTTLNNPSHHISHLRVTLIERQNTAPSRHGELRSSQGQIGRKECYHHWSCWVSHCWAGDITNSSLSFFTNSFMAFLYVRTAI